MTADITSQNVLSPPQPAEAPSEPTLLSYKDKMAQERLRAAMRKVLPGWFDLPEDALDDGEWGDMALEILSELAFPTVPEGTMAPRQVTDRPFITERDFMEVAQQQYRTLHDVYQGHISPGRARERFMQDEMMRYDYDTKYITPRPSKRMRRI